MSKIETVDQLREIYRPAAGRSLEKQLDRLEDHCRNFIAHSPIVMLATSIAGGLGDVTPRGDEPGFVKILDDKTILLPDRPGNNRLDSLSNILENPQIALIFMIPGVNETLRINGQAEIRDDEELRQLCEAQGKLPATVLKITVAEAYLHCAKALMRSRIWSADAMIDRKDFPTMGQMINDQVGSKDKPESQKQMEARYQQALY